MEEVKLDEPAPTTFDELMTLDAQYRTGESAIPGFVGLLVRDRDNPGVFACVDPEAAPQPPAPGPPAWHMSDGW